MNEERKRKCIIFKVEVEILCEFDLCRVFFCCVVEGVREKELSLGLVLMIEEFFFRREERKLKFL